MSPELVLIRPGQPEEPERDRAGVLNTAPVLMLQDVTESRIITRVSSHLQSSAEIIQKRADKNIKLSVI